MAPLLAQDTRASILFILHGDKLDIGGPPRSTPMLDAVCYCHGFTILDELPTSLALRVPFAINAPVFL